MNKILLPALIFLFFNDCFAQQEFQLAPPVLKYSSAFFTSTATASLQFAQPGTQIFYTLNGKEPTQTDAAYEHPFLIKKSFTTLKAKVFGKGFLPSETVQVTFIKDGFKLNTIEQTPANEKFPGNGMKTLFDNQGGIADMHNKNFLGYQRDSVEINVTLAKKQKIDSVLFDFLQDQGSWIFLPQRISLYYFDDAEKEFEMMTTKDVSSDTIVKGTSCVFEILKPDKNIHTDKLKIILQPLQSIPEGHPGKGTQAWLFIDEIKIY
jgi:hypothetical protein